MKIMRLTICYNCYNYLFYICKLAKELKQAGTIFVGTTNLSTKETPLLIKKYSEKFKLIYDLETW